MPAPRMSPLGKRRRNAGSTVAAAAVFAASLVVCIELVQLCLALFFGDFPKTVANFTANWQFELLKLVLVVLFFMAIAWATKLEIRFPRRRREQAHDAQDPDTPS